ncbi:hypothetical protein E4U54_004324, partial [Claviceps lovelessii]
MTNGLGGMDGLNGVSPVPLVQRGVGMGPSPLTHERRQRSTVLQEHGTEEPETAFYSHNAPYLQSPPNSHSSPRAPNGLLSPPGRADVEQSSKVAQDFVLDCLPFQSPLVNRLSTVEHDAPYSRQAPYGSPNSSLRQVMDAMSRDQIGCMSGLAPAHMHNLDFSFDSSRDDDWRTDTFALKTRSCPSPMGPMSFSQISDPAAIPALEPTPWSDPRSCRTEQRVESVMRHAHDTGFDTFEDLATAYYKTELDKSSSPLSTEQHLSRSKRLPRVISEVYHATESWPDWERRPFCQQLLETTAAMLRSEASAKDSLVANSLQSKDTWGVSEAVESLKEMVQQEMPYSWAINKALVEKGDGGDDPSDAPASYVALATILLQRCSGRVPREQLLRMVEA